MEYYEFVREVADILHQFDSERPIHKSFRPGIGPFGEPQLITVVAQRLRDRGKDAHTQRVPDLGIARQWAVEFKVVRPFGDNGREAEDWSVNMLHPYAGNMSLLGDAVKLGRLDGYSRKGLFVVGYEHRPAKISLDPLVQSFEAIAEQVMGIHLGERIEEDRGPLVHPEHQWLRCIGWEVQPGVAG
jgi:hypothetical protein